MNESVIQIDGLQHRLGSFCLDIPHLALEPGYVLGVLGRNGAGKSTALAILLGLIRPDRGRVQVLGLPLPQAAVAVRRRAGYVPEQAAFYDNLSAGQTAALFKPFYPTWDDAYFSGHLRRFEINPQAPVRTYSKGMRVRLALALALAHRPELLVLDEPTAGLDPVARQEVIAEIAGLMRDGDHAAVISSHITSDLEVADYIGILESGQLIEFEDREQLTERWRRVAGSFNASSACDDGLFVAWTADGASFAGVTNRFSPAWQQQVEACGLRIETAARLTLDEILAYATGRGSARGRAAEVAGRCVR